MLGFRGRFRGLFVVLVAAGLLLSGVVPAQADGPVVVLREGGSSAVHRSYAVGTVASFDADVTGGTVESVSWSSTDSSVAKVVGSGISGQVTVAGEGAAEVSVEVETSAGVATDTVWVSGYTNVADGPHSVLKSSSPLYHSASTSAGVRDTAPAGQELTVTAVSAAFYRVTLPDSFTFDDGIDSQNAYVPKTSVDVPYSSLTVSGSDSVNVGDTTTFNVTGSPKYANDTSFVWSSSDTSIATVDDDGTVTGVKAGSAKITATTSSSHGYSVKEATTITVKTVPVASVIAISPVYLKSKGTVSLDAMVAPDDATNRALSYLSSNAKVASVSATGVVSGHKLGSVEITVSSSDGPSTKVQVKVVSSLPDGYQPPTVVNAKVQNSLASRYLKKYRIQNENALDASTRKPTAKGLRLSLMVKKLKGTDSPGMPTVNVVLAAIKTQETKVVPGSSKISLSDVAVDHKESTLTMVHLTVDATVKFKNAATRKDKAFWTILSDVYKVKIGRTASGTTQVTQIAFANNDGYKNTSQESSTLVNTSLATATALDSGGTEKQTSTRQEASTASIVTYTTKVPKKLRIPASAHHQPKLKIAKTLAYASKWTSGKHAAAWQPPNKKYYTSAGDDNCANFVSQTLNRGGWTRRAYSHDPAALYNWSNETPSGILWFTHFSYTWSRAKDLYRYLHGTLHRKQLKDPTKARAGDVLFVDWGANGGHRNGVIDHAMLVVGRKDGKPLLDQKTPTRHNETWKMMLKHAKKSNIVKSKFYAIRVG